MAKEKKKVAQSAPKRVSRVTTDDGVKTDDEVTMGTQVRNDDSVSVDDGVVVDSQHDDRHAVARRAYELYAARGYEDGHDLDDWLTAEHEGLSRVRVRFLVSGRVQGVAYRASAVDAATRIGGLRGFVANRDDGAVEGIVEGSADDVEAFLLWCEAGPSTARVTSVDRSDDPSTEALGVFAIRR